MAFSDIGANPAWGIQQNKRIDARTYNWNVPGVRTMNGGNYVPDAFVCKLYGLGIDQLDGPIEVGGGGGSTRPSTGMLYPRFS